MTDEERVKKLEALFHRIAIMHGSVTTVWQEYVKTLDEAMALMESPND
jgi:hypothetical protein